MPKFSTIISPCLTVDVNYVDDNKFVIHALYKNEHYFSTYGKSHFSTNEKMFNSLQNSKLSVLEINKQIINLVDGKYFWKLDKKDIVTLTDGDLTFEYSLAKEKLAVKYKNFLLREVDDCYDLTYKQYEILEEYGYDYSDSFNGCVSVVFLDFSFYHIFMTRLEFERNGIEYYVDSRFDKLRFEACDGKLSYYGEVQYSGKLYYQICREVFNNSIDIVEMQNNSAIIIFVNGTSIILKRSYDEETLSGSRSEIDYNDNLHTQESIDSDYNSGTDSDTESDPDYNPESDYENDIEYDQEPTQLEKIAATVGCMHHTLNNFKTVLDNQSADLDMTNLEIHENNIVVNDKLNNVSDILNKQQKDINDMKMVLNDQLYTLISYYNKQKYICEDIKSFMFFLMIVLFIFL